jgi:hypothetical protein
LPPSLSSFPLSPPPQPCLVCTRNVTVNNITSTTGDSTAGTTARVPGHPVCPRKFTPCLSSSHLLVCQWSPHARSRVRCWQRAQC